MSNLRYVSLHNHSTFSIYDGLGTPAEFYDYVLKSGGDAMALTEHGSMNSLGYAVTAAAALKQKGAKFRAIYGVEAYVHPNLEDWHRAHEDKDGDNNLVVENEAESKGKWYDPIKRRHHLVITALNNTGLQNLYKLVSKSYRRENFYRFPRMDFDMLRQHNDGLAISTACLAGLPTYLALRDENADTMKVFDEELLPLLEIFGKDRAFLELQFNALPEQAIVNHKLIEYSNHSGYKLIVASDAHYCRPDLWREREIYKALGYQTYSKSGQDLAEAIPKHVEDLKCELYPHNAEQIYGAYERYFRGQSGIDDETVRDAINRTHDIAWQLMGDVQPDSSIKLPKYVPVAGAPTPIMRLAQLCIGRLKEKRAKDSTFSDPVYMERLKYELKIIESKNVASYFLTKKAILDTLRKKLLLGVGRGSGAGSLVNYLLDITLADPIAGGLLFERFISPSRAEMPDIDSDCEDKDQAHELLKAEFGEDNVLAISNYNTLKLKSLVKDVSKLYSVPFEEVNAVTKLMEVEARDAIMESIGNDQKLYEFTYAAAYEHSPTFREFIDRYPDVGACLANLFKSVKSIGRHAGGVLIVPEADSHLPIIRVRNVLQSPFTEGLTAQHLKLFGLIKFDVLGLTTLKIIRRCVELVLKNKFRVDSPTSDDVWWFYNEYLHPDVIDPADQEVFENVYHSGRFPSIFQFAENGVQEFVKKAKPRSVTDLAAITALWRPGALSGQGDQRYLDATVNPPVYEHPILEEILGESRSVLIFQEQFMLLANKLAGFSLDEADKLRKLLVKPSAELGQEMRAQRIKVGERFVNGCREKGLTKERAEDLWFKEIMGFISYGFNKSHSYVYAYNSYQCAWLFTKYAEEWIKACLEKDPDLERTIAIVKELGYEVVKPDVNDSLADEWQIIGNRCVPPLVAIKGIGDAAAQELVAQRGPVPEDFGTIETGGKFTSLRDFFWSKDDKGHQKWRWSKFNKKAIEALVKLEAFDSLWCVGDDATFNSYAHMLNVLFHDKNFDKLKKGVWKEGRGKKAVTHDLQIETLETYDTQPEPWSNVERIQFQRELTGTFDRALLFSPNQADFINKNQIVPYTEARDGEIIIAWFFVLKCENKTTQRGKPYLKLTISDGCGNQATLNYFESIETRPVTEGELHIAKLTREDWFLNTRGKINRIKT